MQLPLTIPNPPEQLSWCQKCLSEPSGELEPYPDWCSRCIDNYDPSENSEEHSQYTLSDAFRAFAQDKAQKLKI